MTMISVDKALGIILENVFSLDTVTTGINSAFGRVLAEDIVSDIDIPPFNKSAMDGYAVRASDLSDVPSSLKVIDSISAGSISRKKLQPGTCVKIMTGAPVPEGADAVVMIEDTELVSDASVSFTKKVKPGQNVCTRGEDVTKGTTILRKGTVIKGPEIAVCASVGRVFINVVRTPTVGIVSTGSEIVEPSHPLEVGKIRNSNGPMLESLVKGTGFSAEYLGLVRDNEDELSEVMARGFMKDVLLLSGGVSMGDYDLIPEILEKQGAQVLFHKVRVKPGKPLLFAKKDVCQIFGIPGNPVSNFTTFFMFIKPALFKMMGRSDYLPEFIDAMLATDFANTSKRVLVVPSSCWVERGMFNVTPFMLNGSADIAGCIGANCLSIMEEGVHKRGERIRVLLLGDGL
jgi:molybdopterin molybdotransferase